MPNPELTDVVGSRVRDARRRAGLSVDQLARRCAKIGAPQLSATALYLIEGGGRGKSGKRPRRRVTVEEWLGIAYALEVSPLTLLLPEEDTPHYPITPDVVTSARAVYEWLVGERLPPLPTPNEPVEWTDEDRASAWFVFTRMLRYVPEPSANWQVNNAMEQARDHGRRLELESEKHRLAVEAQLKELGERLDQLTKGSENGKPADQTDPSR
jgi:hypothetical protein